MTASPVTNISVLTGLTLPCALSGSWYKPGHSGCVMTRLQVLCKPLVSAAFLRPTGPRERQAEPVPRLPSPRALVPCPSDALSAPGISTDPPQVLGGEGQPLVWFLTQDGAGGLGYSPTDIRGLAVPSSAFSGTPSRHGLAEPHPVCRQSQWQWGPCLLPHSRCYWVLGLTGAPFLALGSGGQAGVTVCFCWSVRTAGFPTPERDMCGKEQSGPWVRVPQRSTHSASSAPFSLLMFGSHRGQGT